MISLYKTACCLAKRRNKNNSLVKSSCLLARWLSWPYSSLKPLWIPLSLEWFSVARTYLSPINGSSPGIIAPFVCLNWSTSFVKTDNIFSLSYFIVVHFFWLFKYTKLFYGMSWAWQFILVRLFVRQVSS